MKTARQNEILALIEQEHIETQAELADALRRRGYKVTQATVSRDIRELRLVKAGGSGGYHYDRPSRQEHTVSDRLIRILRDSMVSVDHAGQMVVVRTLSGSANVAAEAIDTMEWPEILGTIAGDNTIFIVVRDAPDAAGVAERLAGLTQETE